jgi:hypothetical protein
MVKLKMVFLEMVLYVLKLPTRNIIVLRIDSYLKSCPKIVVLKMYSKHGFLKMVVLKTVVPNFVVLKMVFLKMLS